MTVRTAVVEERSDDFTEFLPMIFQFFCIFALLNAKKNEWQPFCLIR